MVCRYGRPTWLLTFVALAVLAIAAPVLGQAGGVVRGVVQDEQGQPVEGATVVLTGVASGRRFEVKTNRRGEFLQIGLTSGGWTVIAEKGKLGSEMRTVNVRMNSASELELVLNTASAASSAEAKAKNEELKKLFEDGVAAGNAGRQDEAIEKFKQAVAVNPDCFDCYNNLGFAYVQKKDYENAEAAYKKSSEVNPNDATSFNGLATIYNAQRKFDLAAAASAKATELSTNLSSSGGGGAEAFYNQGVILWNGGKIAEAKKSFESAVQADPNHAEAHYQLGMALVNEGNLAGAATEFETYLKLAPEGPNAATAKSLVAQLKT